MLQDIQTFSDITAIETYDKLAVELTIVSHGRTVNKISLNGINIVAPYTRAIFDLFDQLKLDVNLLDFDEGTSGLEIELIINGVEILPKYQYLSSNKKCYIDTIEPWIFTIPDNFYTWYHEISGQGWIA